jgi:N-methylhydantoinase B
VAIRPIVAPVRVSRVSRRSWGGRPFSDGIDGAASMVVNFSNYSVEVIEREYPLRIEEYGFLPDSGGPGKFRAGLVLVRRYRFLEQSGTFQIRADRSRFAAYGLAGGVLEDVSGREDHT